MKNLFNYATKELSQDAFLRWLFESWEDENIKPIVKKLLTEFCKLNDFSQVIEITTKAQWFDIDITVFVKLKNNNNYAIFIEDKTFSNEHKQLKTYDEKIQNHLEENYFPVKIFYKTNKIKQDELDRIEEANNLNKNNKQPCWLIFDIDKINDLFFEFSETKNILLSQYIQHIKEIKIATNWQEKPLSNDNPIDYVKWESYFNKIGKPFFDKYKAGGVWKAGGYSYVCLVFKKNNFVPYLEIRSRDCLNNSFEVFILCYDLDKDSPFTPEKIKQKQKPLKQEISKRIFFTDKGCRKEPNGFSKQLGKYESKKPILSDEDFIYEIKQCLKEYDKLIALWDNIN